MHPSVDRNKIIEVIRVMDGTNQMYEEYRRGTKWSKTTNYMNKL